MAKETIASVKAELAELIELANTRRDIAEKNAAATIAALRTEQEAHADTRRKCERLEGTYESAERRFEILRGFLGAKITDDDMGKLPAFIVGIIERPASVKYSGSSDLISAALRARLD